VIIIDYCVVVFSAGYPEQQTGDQEAAVPVSGSGGDHSHEQ